MAQLSVRDVPDDVLRELRDEASEFHTSVNAVVRAALADYAAQRRRQRELAAALPKLDEFRARLRARWGGPSPIDSADLIRIDRER